MAICPFCEHEMLTGESCDHVTIIIAGQHYEPVRYGRERFWQEASIQPPAYCDDCGVAIGGIHHEGCDMEECPLCHGQLLFCECAAEMIATVLAA